MKNELEKKYATNIIADKLGNTAVLFKNIPILVFNEYQVFIPEKALKSATIEDRIRLAIEVYSLPFKISQGYPDFNKIIEYNGKKDVININKKTHIIFKKENIFCPVNTIYDIPSKTWIKIWKLREEQGDVYTKPELLDPYLGKPVYHYNSGNCTAEDGFSFIVLYGCGYEVLLDYKEVLPPISSNKESSNKAKIADYKIWTKPEEGVPIVIKNLVFSDAYKDDFDEFISGKIFFIENDVLFNKETGYELYPLDGYSWEYAPVKKELWKFPPAGAKVIISNLKDNDAFKKYEKQISNSIYESLGDGCFKYFKGVSDTHCETLYLLPGYDWKEV